ncbi:MAG: hypothetical protein JXB88_04420 [Spirochaetales bacterium]|nr:hypothetical protein [Spirochaetales bacterium]
MKKIIIMFMVFSALFIMLTGCPPIEETMSIEERIKSFEDGLNNSNREDLYENFHPDAGQYEQIKDPDYWEESIFFYGNRPFDFSNLSDPVDAGSGKMEVTADYTSGVDSGSCTFVMKEDGADDWYILQFTYGEFEIYKTGQCSQ